MFNFKRLISKYGKIQPFKLVQGPGYFDYTNGGVWVEGTSEWIVFDGAVTPLSENFVKLQQDYTIEDKKLYCYESLENGTKIKHKEIEYTVMEKQDFEDFDENLNIYTLKRGPK